MSSARKKQVADNLDQVAQDIIDYILKQTPNELLSILTNVKAHYETTQTFFLSLAERVLYWYSRQRSSAIQSAQQAISNTEPTEKMNLLFVIVGLLSEGACESTSANTLLLDNLIAKLPQYEALEKDERINKLGRKTYATQAGMRSTLCDIVVTKAQQTMDEYQRVMEAENKVLAVDKPEVHKLKIDPEFKNRLTNAFSGVSVFIKSERPPIVVEDYNPNQNLRTKYADVIAALEYLHLHRVKQRQQSILEPSPGFAEAREKIGTLFHVKSTASQPSLQEIPKQRRNNL